MNVFLPIVLGAILLPISGFAMKPAECQKISTEAENLSYKGDKEEALELALKVVNNCKPAPYAALMTAGKITLRTKGNPAAALPYFIQGTQQGPDYYLGYLNVSAAYMEMGILDNSIEYAKKAIAKAKNEKDRHKGVFNLGLGLYKKAAKEEKNELYEKGAKEFRKLVNNPQFKGQSLYYIGLYEETVKRDAKEAKSAYTKSCESGFSRSCPLINDIDVRIMALPGGAGENQFKTADDFKSLSIEQLEKEMHICYKVKYRMPESAIKSTVKSITSSFQGRSEKEKKDMMVMTLGSMQCPR